MSISFLGPLVESSCAATERIEALTERLEDFYKSYREYPAFAAPTRNTVWLELICGEVRNKLQSRRRKVRVLEVGAGAGSDFSAAPGIDRRSIEYTAQDITNISSSNLAKVADIVHVGPLKTLEGEYDIIFSLFVLEHIPDPHGFLCEVDRLLAPQGVHILVCPRYDLPGYVCPSMRHMSRQKLLRVESLRFVLGVLSRLSNPAPRFWVNTEPAVFHQKWSRDADAVHVVSQHAVALWHRLRGYNVTRLKPETIDTSDWFFKRALTLSLAFQKPSLAEEPNAC
jgi:2-polyprenyl-3-methyl-5-hydroxy-6-metoxy-1,4-benzoquinol methylase